MWRQSQGEKNLKKIKTNKPTTLKSKNHTHPEKWSGTCWFSISRPVTYCCFSSGDIALTNWNKVNIFFQVDSLRFCPRSYYEELSSSFVTMWLLSKEKELQRTMHVVKDGISKGPKDSSKLVAVTQQLPQKKKKRGNN